MKKGASKLFGAVTGAAAVLSGVGAFALMPEAPDEAAFTPFQGRNFAHRGLHNIEKGIPENSLAAFHEACAYGYGSELDVQLTKDGEVVVFHDDSLQRLCGAEEKVSDLTLEELEQYRLLGTKQGIPLLSEVLALVAGRVPLIVELKSGSSVSELCEKTYSLLSSYEGAYVIESFDPRIVRWFRVNAPEVIRGQLSMRAEHYGKRYSSLQRFLLGNCLLNFLGRPNFIAYEITNRPALVEMALRLGAKSICWTSTEENGGEGNEQTNDAVIFEGYHPKVWY